MGWASGRSLMEEIMPAVQELPRKFRHRLYVALIEAFEGNDCDTLYECCDSSPDFKLAFEEVNPPDDDEE